MRVIFGFCILMFAYSGVPANSNSWHIRTGKKTVMSSGKNKMGDTIYLARQLGNDDRFVASMFFCGSNTANATAKLTLKNEEGLLITECIQRLDHGLYYWAELPASSILHSPVFERTTMICVYFTVKNQAEDFNNCYLLGCIRLPVKKVRL